MSIEIVHELRMARGSIRKKAILKTYWDNDEWKAILRMMYDTSINYYTSAPNDNTFVDEDIDTYAMLDDLEMLSSRHYTGHAARDFALECSQQYGEIFRLILGGSMRAGVSITTINSVYPGLIDEFKVMLAKDTDIRRYPVLASTKYDGVRVLAFVHGEGHVQLRTRQGKVLQIESLQHAMKYFAAGVYDGELVSGSGLQAGRTVITGQVNKCLKGTATDIDDYTFCVFDFIPLDAWDRQQCTWTYAQRYKALQDSAFPTFNVRIAEQEQVDNANAVEELFQDKLDKGYEGLILRDEADPYLWKRSTSLIKKKATKECVLTCIGVLPGTGKYEGMVGSLVCAGRVAGKEVHVKVGTGLSDHDREMASDYYIGKEIEIAYNDLVRAKNRTIYSLFLPRFLRLKGDYNI